MNSPQRCMTTVVITLALLGGSAFALGHDRSAWQQAIRFTDARQQAAEFISYQNSIVLTPEQKKVMDEALSAIPAPCCSKFSIATCCCPCNLAKTAWGLSKFLIAKHRATALQVNAAVSEWLRFTNASGYTGDACFTGGCNRSFEKRVFSKACG